MARKDAMTHDEVVRTEFARQAEGFGTAGIFAADPRLNGWVCRHLEPLTPDMIVLEVACGAAHQAQAVAERVRQVVGIDLTPEMLDAGRRRLEATEVTNVLLEEGSAVTLPFLDESFDLSYSRFALHHVEDPTAVLAESSRVVRSGGRVAVIDLVSPDPELGDRFNDYERRRDPSHTRALTREELDRAFASTGLEIVHRTQAEPTIPVERWLEQASTPPDVGEAIAADLRAELAGGPVTGMRPVDDEGMLSYTQTWEIVVATKA
jgi:ubiquinone/menaquinone biosynthesis C-methylase UbiE